MKIIDKRPTTDFVSVVWGDVFVHKKGTYIRIAEAESAVDLNDGTIVTFKDDDRVQPVDAEIHINGKR